MLPTEKGVDAKHSIQLDDEMCATITRDQAALLSEAGWAVEPYDPIKHAHPFADSGLPKTADEVLEQIKFHSPEARDFARQAIMLEAANRLKLEEGSAQSIADHDEQLDTQKAAADSMVGHYERKAQETAEAPVRKKG